MSLGVGNHTERSTEICGICRDPIVMERPIDVFDVDLPFFAIGTWDIAEDHGLCGIMLLGTFRFNDAPVGLRVRRDEAFIVFPFSGTEIPVEVVTDELWAQVELNDFVWSFDD